MSDEIIKTENNQLAMADDAFVFPESFFNTVDVSTMAGAATVANALNASISLNEFGGEILDVVDIIAVPGVRSQTGEQCINTHLVLADGTTLFSQSAGIARSAKFIVGFMGKYIHDGIKIRVKEQKLRNGNTLKSLEIVTAE